MGLYLSKNGVAQKSFVPPNTNDGNLPVVLCGYEDGKACSLQPDANALLYIRNANPICSVKMSSESNQILSAGYACYYEGSSTIDGKTLYSREFSIVPTSLTKIRFGTKKSTDMESCIKSVSVGKSGNCGDSLIASAYPAYFSIDVYTLKNLGYTKFTCNYVVQINYQQLTESQRNSFLTNVRWAYTTSPAVGFNKKCHWDSRQVDSRGIVINSTNAIISNSTDYFFQGTYTSGTYLLLSMPWINYYGHTNSVNLYGKIISITGIRMGFSL